VARRRVASRTIAVSGPTKTAIIVASSASHVRNASRG
jgi:hypothetical protein